MLKISQLPPHDAELELEQKPNIRAWKLPCLPQILTITIPTANGYLPTSNISQDKFKSELEGDSVCKMEYVFDQDQTQKITIYLKRKNRSLFLIVVADEKTKIGIYGSDTWHEIQCESVEYTDAF